MPCVHFHVARGNPLAALAKKGGPWLIAVAGHDAYVSPDWYATSDQVPTWLYEAVELVRPGADRSSRATPPNTSTGWRRSSRLGTRRSSLGPPSACRGSGEMR